VAAVFRSTAEGETAMRTAISSPRGTATRRRASDRHHGAKSQGRIAGETHEYTDMYPGMARSARSEASMRLPTVRDLARPRSRMPAFTKTLSDLRLSIRCLTPEPRQATFAAAAPRSAFSQGSVMREGSLRGTDSHPIDGKNPDFWDEAKASTPSSARLRHLSRMPALF